jgi:hypothetical protein
VTELEPHLAFLQRLHRKLSTKRVEIREAMESIVRSPPPGWQQTLAMLGRHMQRLDTALQVIEEVATEEITADATQKGQQPENNPPQHQGDDGGRTPEGPGSGSSPTPSKGSTET